MPHRGGRFGTLLPKGDTAKRHRALQVGFAPVPVPPQE
jgi:hypothetical protein